MYRVPKSSVIIDAAATLQAGTCTRSRLITYLLVADPWSNSCGRKGRGPQSSVIIEAATFHAGTCTRNRLITYTLDSSNSISGTIHVEEGVEYHV